MRAVNLIPVDLRGARGSGGRPGTAAYAVLGVLAVALVFMAAFTIAGKSVTDKKNELVRVTAEADAAEARAGQLEPYKRFADLRAKRAETIGGLARNRFNWPHALREVSRVLPDKVWLTQVVGTVAPGVSVDDASSGATGSLRSALPVPAVELAGCSYQQDDVARYLADLRRIEGVTRVSIAASEKVDSTGAGGGSTSGGSGGTGGDCRQGNARIPKFEAVVFFEGSTATPSQAAAGTAPAQPTDGKEPSK